MITGDPLRLRRSYYSAIPINFFQTFVPAGAPIVGVNPGLPGTMAGPNLTSLTRSWIAGPGVKVSGVTNAVWSDHTDIRPTMLSLVG